jgi:hypothetical protein
MVRGYKKAAIRKALEKAAKETKKKFKKTTATWNHQPVFETRIKDDTAEVGTNDERYRWINDGYYDHEIKPRKPGGVMAWQSQFKSKTLPRKIMSRQGGKTGPVDTFARYVGKHYITPREFDKVIQGEMEKEFEKLFEKAMEEQLFTHFARTIGWNGTRMVQGLIRVIGEGI